MADTPVPTNIHQIKNNPSKWVNVGEKLMNASRIQKKARKEIEQFQSEDTSFKEPAIKWLDRKFWGFDTSVAWDTAPGWLLLKNRKHTYRQQNLSFFFTYNIYAQYILYVFEQFQLKPVFKNNSQGPSSCFFPLNRNLPIPIKDLWEPWVTFCGGNSQQRK